MSIKNAPDILKYQFTADFNIKISDKCCNEMKKKPLHKWEKENNRKYSITGLMKAEKGARENARCIIAKKGRVRFNPLAVMSKEWEEWFIKKYDVRLCELYYPPYNFARTGCKGCPFALTLQEQLQIMQTYLPAERKQCEYIWKPIYQEYRRIGYRLKKDEQLKLF